MRIAAIFASFILCAGAAAAARPQCAAPISQDDIRQISRAIRRVTSKPILMIMSTDEEKPVPGSVVTGHSYLLDTTTGERKDQYTRTDLVSVYMRYTDRCHVDVYIVRKLRGQWKIEEKKDWFL
jgi:hypothetical protein